MKRYLLPTIALLSFPAFASAATFVGNGATGFGGPVGNGSVDITDSATGMTVKFNRGLSGSLNDVLVLYFYTRPGGYLVKKTSDDNAVAACKATSRTKNENPPKHLVT